MYIDAVSEKNLIYQAYKMVSFNQSIVTKMGKHVF